MLSRFAGRSLTLLAVAGVVLGGAVFQPRPATAMPAPGGQLRPGQEIEVGPGKFCTLGPFAYAGETPVFITAGHCITQTGTVITAPDDAGVQASIGMGVKPPDADTGTSSSPGVDFGIILVADPAFWHLPTQASPAGDPNFRVAGFNAALFGSDLPQLGTPVCSGGAANHYYRCGVVTGLGMTVDWAGAGVVSGLTRTSICVNKGDSGAPVYQQGTLNIVGIINGGAYCVLNGAGLAYFTPIRQVFDRFGLEEAGTSTAEGHGPAPARTAIWTPGTDGRPIVYGMTLQDLRAFNRQMFARGYRMSQLSSYADASGTRRYDAIWTPGTDGRPIVYGMTLQDLRAFNRQMFARGYRMSQLSSYADASGTRRYDAIWTPGTDGRPITYGTTWADISTRHYPGYQLTVLYGYDAGDGTRRYDAIWTPVPGGRDPAFRTAGVFGSFLDLRATNAVMWSFGYRMSYLSEG